MTIKDQLNYEKNVIVPLLAGQAAAEQSTTYTTDGALSLNTRVAILAKTSAGAFTLAAPTANDINKRLTIISNSAYAHVVTATDLIEDGVTGGAKDTMTFAAFKGAAIELLALDSLKYAVINKNVVTVAAV